MRVANSVQHYKSGKTMGLEVATTVTKEDITFYLSVATTILGIATLFVGFSQMKIASAKVRLDLYNKRFNIYVAALEYYQAMWNHPINLLNLNQKAETFIKHYRESSFLFSNRDGIYETLTKIKDNGAVVKTYEEWKQDSSGVHSVDGLNALHTKSVTARERIAADLQTLEKQIADYIDFRVVEGWALLGIPRWLKWFSSVTNTRH
ncbi:hypothetical protein [Pseudomonas pharyngis]|uniref:hypothetical protein n=1 Tax=Pseudomonas pharyngis TaxID=2892333 RepID=UPI001F2917CB|nr:hypothetical protein [Pseudomonas pharyngis]